MKILKKLLMIIISATMFFYILFYFDNPSINAKFRVNDKSAVRVSVLLRAFDDPYTALIKESFEKIQKENNEKVEFTFYDCKNDQSLQNNILDTILEEGKADVIFLSLSDAKSTKYIVDNVKEKNIPIVLFNREPPTLDAIRSYNKAYFVGTRPEEAGVLQGELVADLWKKNKAIIDKNSDNIIQYVMLMGVKNDLEAIGRTRYSISTINDLGIETQELALRVCDWDENAAKEAMEALFLQTGDKIEVIISNNDAMAIGAIEVLQKYGYNKGDANKTITVVGVDGIPKAVELIKEGIMSGSVVQDAYSMAKATYDIGMNLVDNKAPLEGTNYKFDDSGVAIRIPYKEYIETGN